MTFSVTNSTNSKKSVFPSKCWTNASRAPRRSFWSVQLEIENGRRICLGKTAAKALRAALADSRDPRYECRAATVPKFGEAFEVVISFLWAVFGC